MIIQWIEIGFRITLDLLIYGARDLCTVYSSTVHSSTVYSSTVYSSTVYSSTVYSHSFCLRTYAACVGRVYAKYAKYAKYADVYAKYPTSHKRKRCI